MSNETPLSTIDPSQAQVLLASNLADDDLLWVVRCSAQELHNLFDSPVAWVASLAELPGWQDAISGKPSPVPILSRDFVMTAESTDVEDPDGWVSVQGISGTNVLKVLSTEASAIRSLLYTDLFAEATAAGMKLSVDEARALSDKALLAASDDPFGPFWKIVSDDPKNPPSNKKKFLISVLEQLSRCFGHFEIFDPTDTPLQNAQRNASFLLACVFDRKGLAGMLQGLDKEALFVPKSGKASHREAPFVEVGEPFTPVYGSSDPGVTAMRGGDPPSGDEVSCLFVDGTWVPSSHPDGLYLVNNGVMKRWGVDSPP